MDYVATKEYLSRTPQPPAYLFLIDVSRFSSTSGMIECVAESILKTIDSFEERTMIGFITFDSQVHFYNLNPKLSQPQMIASAELEENLIPLPSSSLLVDAKDSKKVIVNLLTLLQSGMFADNQEKDNCLGSALKAAARILGPVGGKLCLFLSSLPSVGPFKLVNREKEVKGMDTDSKLAQQLTGEYKEMALRLAQDQISVDMFLTTSSYVDVATISSLSKYTGGKVKYYPGFQHDITGDQLIHDLKRVLTNKTNFEAVMRVRVSSGLTVKNYYGNTFLGKKGLMLLPNIDQDSVFAVEIGHESSFVSTVNACVQVAVLYTNNRGERLIRVHTITLPTTQKLSDLYKHADVNATIALMSKIAADESTRFGLVNTRNKLRDWNVNVFKNFRNLQKTNKLVLPASLTLLPLYTQALAKSYALSSDPFIKIDLRMACVQSFSNDSIEKILYTIQPELLEIQGNNEDITVSPLSSSCLNPKSVYLMNAGTNLFLWIGKETPEEIQKEIFSGWNHIVDPEACPIDDNYNFGKYFIEAVEMYRKDEFLSLRLIRQDGPLEKLFTMRLTEDKTASGMGYLDFMNHLYKQMDLL
jgi:protein transport protein SEC24